MGYRSTFTTDENCVPIPPWFTEKYKDSVHFRIENEQYKFPISSRQEMKAYGFWENLLTDLQRCLLEWDDKWKSEFTIHFVFLHEDGKHDKYEITTEEIQHIL